MSAWDRFVERYRLGEWRTPIFRDMILEDVRRFPRRPTVLDIGCGAGFDGAPEIQHELALAAGEYFGVEPDSAVALGPYFTNVHRRRFEDAPLPPCSVDVAFAVMVIEHLKDPKPFWEKLWQVLRPDGVFWGFTVDARHWFCRASLWLEYSGIKDLYLHHFLRRRDGDSDYQNYPVYYHTNTPSQVLAYVPRFGRCDFVNFSRVGQLNYYLPAWLHRINAGVDRSLMSRGKPGAILAIRLAKGHAAAGANGISR